MSMKKFFIILLVLCLFACSEKPLPKPELADGIRGSQFGIDKNINEETIDNYLNRKDSVYIDCRMLKDEANYEAIGGDSYLSGYVKGFEIIPFPYICNVVGLPEEVGNTYSGKTLYTLNDDGTYSPNFEESNTIIEKLYPKDKVIFLMCGGGGYAGMAKNFLIANGYDENKIYNVGGFWFYNGKNAISTKQDDGTYDFSGIKYHEINFNALTPINSDNNINIDPRNTNIKEIENVDDLLSGNSDALLFIYLPACSSCASFRPIVEEFANSKQIDVYSITLDKLKEKDDFKDVKFTPSLAIIKEGKILDFLKADNNEDSKYYENVYNLSTWISEYLDTNIIEGEASTSLEECEDACTLG